MSQSNKTLWTIRFLCDHEQSGNFTPYMENYYPTREMMRVRWKEVMPALKGIGCPVFKAERYKMERFDLIGKRSYTPVR